MKSNSSHAEFESLDDYDSFGHHVKSEARYALNEPSNRFLKMVIKTSRQRRRRLKKGETLWRAQLGHERTWEVFPPDSVATSAVLRRRGEQSRSGPKE